MLGVLAVPSWMTLSDFLEFVAPAVGIGHLRIIRYVEIAFKQNFVLHAKPGLIPQRLCT